jgi:hypothetical protein
MLASAPHVGDASTAALQERQATEPDGPAGPSMPTDSSKALDLALKPEAEWQAELRKAINANDDVRTAEAAPAAPPVRYALSQAAGVSDLQATRMVGPPGSRFSLGGPPGAQITEAESESVERVDPRVKAEIEMAIAAG